MYWNRFDPRHAVRGQEREQRDVRKKREGGVFGMLDHSGQNWRERFKSRFGWGVGQADDECNWDIGFGPFRRIWGRHLRFVEER